MPCISCLTLHADARGCPAVFWPALPEVESLEGLQIGPLWLVRKLGGRALGTVYQAEPGVPGTPLAVKVFHPRVAATPGVLSRLYAQVQAVRQLGSHHLARVFALRESAGGHHCLVMEHVVGSSCLHRGEPLPAAEVMGLLAPLLEVLEGLARRGIRHLGLHPEQLVLVEDGGGARLRAVDFGVCTGPQAPLAELAQAPALDEPLPDAPGAEGVSDLFALAVVGYRLLLGRLPELEPPADEASLAEAMGGPRAAALLKVLRRALSVRPQDRYGSAGELRAALEVCRRRQLAPRLADAEERPSRLRVRFAGPAEPLRDVEGVSDLSPAGLFLALEEPLPPLAQRLDVELALGETVLMSAGDVVRHVCAEEALAWGAKSGLFVQFVDPPDEVRALLSSALCEGAEPARDLELQGLLDRGALAQEDPYALLEVALHADFPEVQRRADGAVRKLNHFRLKPLPSEQRRALEALVARVERARAVLGDPASRADLDAVRGNVHGVARCLGAGIAAPLLERLRASYLSARPGQEERAQVRAAAAEELLALGSLREASLLFEDALAGDPLNVQLQRRYWMLQRQLRAAESEASAA